MESMTIRPTRLEVNLENVRYNYRLIQRHVGGARVMAVIKANSYSLGALPMAWTLRQAGADFFGVATPDEALELREGGLTCPVLVLGPAPYEAAPHFVRFGVRAAVTDMKMAQAMSEAAVKQNRKAYIHLKIDSGLGRIGFFPEAAEKAAGEISALPGIDMEGAFTHFALADTGEMDYTREQYRRFLAVLDRLSKKGITFRVRHCCNSAATLEAPEMALDAVRPGHIIHGMYPSPEVKRSIIVKPCLEFKTAVAALRELPEGTGVGYGQNYVTAKEEKIAVLPLGYADGYFRELWSRGAEVLVRGRRCPVVGRICMDQTMINVTSVPDVSVGDEVVLIGRQGNAEVSLDEIAEKMDTLACVPPTMISKRVPRVYIDNESSEPK